MERVVVTGFGCISALGHDRRAFWEALASGRSGIGMVSRPGDRERVGEEGDETWAGAAVTGFDPRDHFERRRIAWLDPFAQFALVAAREAVAHAGLDAAALKERCGVILGTGVGGDDARDDTSYRLYGRGRTNASPSTIGRAMANAAVSQVSMEQGVIGPSYTVADACASSTHAIGLASQLIRCGLLDAALTGGSETLPSFSLLRSWQAMHALAPDTCRPFAAGRKGLVLGEGAGVLVLESLSSARARGAPVLAEILGVGASADAGDLVRPSTDGIVAAMARALADAGIAPEEVDYVNAHGTGTKLNDAAETRALEEVFGAHAQRLAISSTKSMHGHALGASGALELIATVEAMAHSLAPPTVHYDSPDPECGLDYVPNRARELEIGTALTSSFAFGGLNGCLVVRRPELRDAA